MDNSLIRGDTVELQCILAFQQRGFYCSIPFSGSCKYDVVVDINDKLYKIQCKSGTFHEDEGTLCISTTRQTTNTKRTVSYLYLPNEVDYFYTNWKDYHFLIPISEVSTSKNLRLKEPRNGIQQSMSIADDYLLDKVIDSIKNNKPLSRFYDNCFIRIDKNGKQELMGKEEMSIYTDRQIRYIRECISKEKMGYNYYWKYKEFPTL